MLKKEEIIQIMKALNLPETEYWILAGSALVMHDIRKTTNDIDIGCTTKLFDQLAKGNTTISLGKNHHRCMALNEDIEVFENWHVEEVVTIDQLPVGSLQSIRNHKLSIGREKDLRDIQLIDAALTTRKES